MPTCHSTARNVLSRDFLKELCKGFLLVKWGKKALLVDHLRKFSENK